MDLENDEVEYLTDWVGTFKKFVPDFSHTLFAWGLVLDGRVLYAPAVSADVILKLDMETGEHEFTELNTDAGGSNVILETGTDLWLFSCNDAKIVKWDRSANRKTVIDKFPEKFVPAVRPMANFLFAFQSGGYVYAQRHTASMSVRISVETGEICEWRGINAQTGPVMYGNLTEDFAYVCESDPPTLTVIDLKTMETRSGQIFPDNIKETVKLPDFGQTPLSDELDFRGINELAEYLAGCGAEDGTALPMPASGKSIYAFCKGLTNI
jgi:hypothetical protein